MDDLLRCQGVESARVEFKASWDPKTTGVQVLKTICAFANDLQNLNGGYIVIGVEEKDGQAVLPPKGLNGQQTEAAQSWLRGNANRIDPPYQPVTSVEKVDDRQILVLWVPGSETRPHRAPDGSEKGRRVYYVRLGSETVNAEKNGVLDQLMQLTARVPFDDRRALQATVDDLREGKTREFLKDIRGGLLQETDTKSLYRKLRIATPVNGHDVPKNIGLLMFSDDPELWFPGARIEVVHFPDDASGNIIEEKYFRGSLQDQLRNALAYLERFATTRP
ncbi:AlbA family DNA-binding domain-containing protein [Acanthopleuribacter pedis]